MALTNRYVDSTEGPLVNVNFTELTAGTGIAVLYLGDGDGPLYKLATSQFHAKAGFISVASNGTLDLDFDTTLNMPLTLKGQAVVTLPLQLENTSGVTKSPTRVWTITIRKYSGVTETDIVSGNVTISHTNLLTGASNSQNKTISLPLTVPLTNFKPADILRVTVACATETPDSNSVYSHVGWDPAGRDIEVGTNISLEFNRSTFYCPIKLDL